MYIRPSITPAPPPPTWRKTPLKRFQRLSVAKSAGVWGRKLKTCFGARKPVTNPQTAPKRSSNNGQRRRSGEENVQHVDSTTHPITAKALVQKLKSWFQRVRGLTATDPTVNNLNTDDTTNDSDASSDRECFCKRLPIRYKKSGGRKRDKFYSHTCKSRAGPLTQYAKGRGARDEYYADGELSSDEEEEDRMRWNKGLRIIYRELDDPFPSDSDWDALSDVGPQR